MGEDEHVCLALRVGWKRGFGAFAATSKRSACQRDRLQCTRASMHSVRCTRHYMIRQNKPHCLLQVVRRVNPKITQLNNSFLPNNLPRPETSRVRNIGDLRNSSSCQRRGNASTLDDVVLKAQMWIARETGSNRKSTPRIAENGT